MAQNRKVSVDEVIADLIEKYALPKRKSKAYEKTIVSTNQLKSVSDSIFSGYGEDIELNDLVALFKKFDSFEKIGIVNLPGLPPEIYKMFLKERAYDIGFQALLSVDLNDTEWRSLWNALRSSHRKKERDFHPFEDKERFLMFGSSNACPVEILQEYSKSLKNIRILQDDGYDNKHYFSYIVESRERAKISISKSGEHIKLYREKPSDLKLTKPVKSLTIEKPKHLASSANSILNDIDRLSSKDIFEKEVKLRLNSRPLYNQIEFQAYKSWKNKHIGLPQFDFLSNASKLAIAFPKQFRHYRLVEYLIATELLDEKRVKRLLDLDGPIIYTQMCSQEMFPNSKLYDLLSSQIDKDFNIKVAVKPNVTPEILDIIAGDERRFVCELLLENKNLSQNAKDIIFLKFPELANSPRLGLEEARKNRNLPQFRTREWGSDENDALDVLKKKIRALIAVIGVSNNHSVESLIKEFQIDRPSAVEVITAFQTHKALFKGYQLSGSVGDIDRFSTDYSDLRKLAHNSSTPECLLGLIVQVRNNFNYQDSDITSVMSWVLRNPNVTTSVVALLADRILKLESSRISLLKDHESLDVISRRKRTASQAELDAYDNHDFMFYAGKDANKAILSGDSFGVLLALCSNQKIDPKRLKTISKSSDYLIRFAVARNSRTPREVLGILQSDPHPFVARSAKEALAAI